MTKPTQDKETLREAVARSLCRAEWPNWHESDIDEMFDAYISEADAAIATMFERLRTPSEGMVEAGWAAAEDFDRAEPKECWQAMLAAFQQENSDAD